MILSSGCTHVKHELNQTESLLATGQYEQALNITREHYEASPNNPELKGRYIHTTNLVLTYLVQAGESSLQKGDIENAERSFLRAIAIDANYHRAQAGLRKVEQYRQQQEWLELAVSAINTSDIPTANELLRKILLQSPDNEQALKLRRTLRDEHLGKADQLRPPQT